MRKHRCATDENGKKVFIKEYDPGDIKDPEVLEMEYKKGLVISKIIPYPKPLKMENNKIYYEFIDIRCSLWEKLVSAKEGVTEEEMETVGKYLRKIHDNNIIHGDFGPSNVIFDKEGRIYFIDASFSPHNTGGKVIWEAKNIYHDISLFLKHLDISKPLWKPWIFFKIKKNKIIKKAFLKGYFVDLKKFDQLKNYNQEIIFLNFHCQYLVTKKTIFVWPMFVLAKIFILIKKIKRFFLVHNCKFSKL